MTLVVLGASSPAVASKSKSFCGELLVRHRVAVSPAMKEALALGKRTGILEARVVLQIPTGARGVLPPYVQLIVEASALQKKLEAAGATVTLLEETGSTVARRILRVVGPFEPLLPMLAENPWVAKLITDADPAAAPVPVASPNHTARKQAAFASARAEALRPTHVGLESTIVASIREGYQPQPDAVEVQLLATVGTSSLFLATLPVDQGAERHTLAFVVRIDQNGDAYDAHVERVLTPKELAALLPRG